MNNIRAVYVTWVRFTSKRHLVILRLQCTGILLESGDLSIHEKSHPISIDGYA